MDRRFLGILAALVIIFVGIFAISQRSGDNSGGSANSNAQPTNHVEGEGQKGVTLVEWGDYQCPVCKTFHEALKEIEAQFDKDIYFQFRNLPLTQIHRNAFASARAAEAAGLQGKYFQMHDKLYTNQEKWSSASNPLADFETYAKDIGLNLDQFRKDYASSKVNDSINADLAAFDKTGQNKATPTFFLDGEYIDNSKLVGPQTGGVSIQKFADLIKAEIAKKNP